MTEPRGYRRYLSHVIVACAAVALFAAWSKRDALAAWWNRPAPAASVAPVVNVPAPQVTVEAPPELLFEDKAHEYEIAGRTARNVKVYRTGWVFYNDAETGDWRARFGGEVKRIRAKAEAAE